MGAYGTGDVYSTADCAVSMPITSRLSQSTQRDAAAEPITGVCGKHWRFDYHRDDDNFWSFHEVCTLPFKFKLKLGELIVIN